MFLKYIQLSVFDISVIEYNKRHFDFETICNAKFLEPEHMIVWSNVPYECQDSWFEKAIQDFLLKRGETTKCFGTRTSGHHSFESH